MAHFAFNMLSDLCAVFYLGLFTHVIYQYNKYVYYI